MEGNDCRKKMRESPYSKIDELLWSCAESFSCYKKIIYVDHKSFSKPLAPRHTDT